MFNFTKAIEWSKVEASAAAGTSTLTTETVDMAGYDSAAFIAALGDATVNSVLTLTVLQGDQSDGSDKSALSGATSTVTATTAGADEQSLIVEVHRPLKRYLTATLARATANCELDSIFCARFNARQQPVTQSTNAVQTTATATTLVVSPAES